MTNRITNFSSSLSTNPVGWADPPYHRLELVDRHLLSKAQISRLRVGNLVKLFTPDFRDLNPTNDLGNIKPETCTELMNVKR